MAPATERRPDIDWAKGVAIVGVLLIHANPFAGTVIGEHLVNRSVLVFITLFGLTSELWWRRDGGPWREATLRWYRTRLPRLLVPVWGALALVWGVRFAVDRNLASPLHVAFTFAGYMPWVGTGWFVTLALELVVLFPLLRAGVDLLGGLAALALGAVILTVCQLHMYEMIALVRLLLHDRGPHVDLSFYYFYWIFPPPRVFSIVAGMLLARRRAPIAAREVAVAIALVVAGGLAIEADAGDPPTQQLLMNLVAVPLTIALLGCARTIAWAPPLARALAWYGRHSWGVYLGQLVIHESIYNFATPGTPAPYDLTAPGQAALPVRWAYFALLLVGAPVLVALGERARLAGARVLGTRA